MLVSLSLAASLGAADGRPNVIFLFADDQRADTIGAHGNPHIRTPHLDQLAGGGFSFRRNYCAGSFSGAVCVASRAMLMTGRHWMRIPSKKVASDWKDLPLLPSLLEEEGGYRSHIVGRWHNGKRMLDRSFSSGRAVYMGGMANHAAFQVQDLVDGKLGAKRDAGAFSSTVFGDAAIDFISDAESDQPFFLCVAFMAPHDPRNPPEKYRQMYYDKRPPLPENFLPQHPFKNAPQATSGRDESLAPWPRTREMISDQLCEYYGLITQLDEQVGRIVKALEMNDLAGEASSAAQLQRLGGLMGAARQAYGDKHPLSVSQPEDKTPVYDNAKRTLDVWQPKWIRDKYFGGRERTNHGKK